MKPEENGDVSLGTTGKPLYGCISVVVTAVAIVLAFGLMCLKGCIF